MFLHAYHATLPVSKIHEIVQFTASAFRKLPSIYVFSYFRFVFEGRMWDLIVSIADHCLSFYLTQRIYVAYFIGSIIG